jgi:hypothetical protein
LKFDFLFSISIELEKLYGKKNKNRLTLGLLPACNMLASPINKKEFVVGLSRKSF